MGNGSILGPKEEGEEVDLICEAGSGKPIPRVSWYNGSTLITRGKSCVYNFFKYVMQKSYTNVPKCL